jgi:CCR4-NOT transcriptional regulation complex NOT5 subunit
MERFKVLERETKTKAYSKEALSQHTRKNKDPTLNPKYETYQVYHHPTAIADPGNHINNICVL